MYVNMRGSASLSGAGSLALMVMDRPLSVTQISGFSCSSLALMESDGAGFIPREM